MNSLQRSSFSFRRQGSSGRIWHDQIQFMEPKANGNHSSTTSPLGKNKHKEENVSHMEGNNIMRRRLHGNNDQGATHSNSPLSPSPSSRTQNKINRGFCSSIFGRCMSSPPNRD